MIGKAVDKAVTEGVEPEFLQLDMRKIPEHFSNTKFDAVLCCGNTLVHLTDLSDIRHFLTQTAVILAKGGVLLLQIINYDRILDNNIGGLPTIENEHIRFERSYDYHDDTGLIDFRTLLTVYKTGEKITNIIPLYPLRKGELKELLHPAGFVDIEMFGDFSGNPHSEDDIPLIVKARV
jgi:SAM-dependent methyltransferase